MRATFSLRTSYFVLGSLLVVLAVAGGADLRNLRESAADYEQLVALFKEWRTFQAPKRVNGVPDFTPKAVAEQRRGLTALQGRLAAIDPSGWPVSQPASNTSPARTRLGG